MSGEIDNKDYPNYQEPETLEELLNEIYREYKEEGQDHTAELINALGTAISQRNTWCDLACGETAADAKAEDDEQLKIKLRGE